MVDKEKVKLSPPVWTLYNQVLSTIGADSDVCIKEMYNIEQNYFIDITISENSKARAMATILTPVHEIGNETVYVRVFNGCGKEAQPEELKSSEKVKELVRIFKKALASNDLVLKIWNIKDMFPPIVSEYVGDICVEVAKEVIQFYNDDLSDLYNNYNDVAAYTFKKVLKLEYEDGIKVGTTTELNRNV